MPPIAYVVHSLPGRVRLRVPSRRGDRRYFSQLPGMLQNVSGIAILRVNPAAGSVVLRHEVSLQQVRRAAWRSAAFLLDVPDHRGARRSVRIGWRDSPAAEPTPIAVGKPYSKAQAGRRLLTALRNGHSRSAIENLFHGYAAMRVARDPLTGLMLLGAGAAQLARGDLLSSVLAIAFRAVGDDAATEAGRAG